MKMCLVDKFKSVGARYVWVFTNTDKRKLRPVYKGLGIIIDNNVWGK